MSASDPGQLRLLHTADLHLGAPLAWLGGQAEVRQKDFLLTFRRIIKLAIEQQVDLVLIAGDLFDHPRPEASLFLAVQHELARLLENNIVPVLLPGTHDGVWGGMTPYQADDFPGVIILDQEFALGPIQREINGEPVYFYGAAYRGENPAELYQAMRRQDGEGFHLGLLHGSLQYSSQWEFRTKDLPFTLDELNSWGLDYVALGHYHSYQVLEQNGEVIACYPGSPEGKKFGESGERRVALVDIDNSGTRLRPVAVQSRILQCLTFDMSSEPTLEALRKRLTNLADENLLLRLELIGQVDAPLDTEAICALFDEDFFYLELLDKTEFFDGALVRQLAREETIAGICVRRFQQLLVEQPENREKIERAMKEVVLRFRDDARVSR